MISFLNYIDLFEAKVDDLAAKYPEHADAIRKYNEADPTPTKKFLPWLTKQHMAGNVTPNDARLHSTLGNFDKFSSKLPSKDHSHYNFNDLADHIGKHVEAKMESDGKKNAVEKIYHEPDTGITAQHIKTKEASQKLYGGGAKRGGTEGCERGTSWCVSARSNGSAHMWGHYGPAMHTIHVPGDKDAPFAVHPMSGRGAVITSRHNNGDWNADEAVKKWPHIKGAVDAVMKSSGKMLPELMKSGDNRDKLAALSHPHVDVNVLKAGQKSDENAVRERVAGHPKATPEMIDHALSDRSWHVRMKAAQRKDLNHDQITKAVHDEHDQVQGAIVNNPNLNDKHLEHLIKSENPVTMKKALRHPNMSDSLRTKLFKDESNPEVRIAKASHPDTDPGYIHKALHDSHSEVRTAAASNPSLTPEHINSALDSKDVAVRTMAARHPNITPKNISKAVADPNREVAGTAIQNHDKVTPEHITMAQKHPEYWVRRQAMMSPVATRKHVEAGLKDDEYTVRRAALMNPHATIEDHVKALHTDPDEYVRMHAVDHLMKHDKKNILKHAQTALADSGGSVRMFGAKHANAEQIHNIIHHDDDWRPIDSAMDSKHITPEHLKDIINKPDGSSWTKQKAARHKKADSSVIDTALSTKDSDTRFNEGHLVRRHAMKNKNVTPEHISKALTDTDKGVRMNAAKHKNASHENIMQAVSNSLPSVAIQGLKHPSVTKEHYIEGTKHPHKSVRDFAQGQLLAKK